MKKVRNTDLYLDKKQTAALLQISERTLSYWMQQRLVSFVKIGRTVRFRRSDLEQNTGTLFSRSR